MKKTKLNAMMKKIHWGNVCILATWILMGGLLLFGALRFAFSFLPVSHYDILGDYSYDNEEIIGACGVRKGDKLYDVNCKDAERLLLEKCPYLESAQVERRFPNTLRIVLSEKRASWYVELLGNYYALDAELNVMESVSQNVKFVNGGIPCLTLPHLKKAMVGEPLQFGEDEAEIRYATELMKQVTSTRFKSRLTVLDIENRFAIRIQVDGKYNVYVGTSENISLKLSAVEKALAKVEQEKDCIGAEIDVSDPSSISVRPQYSFVAEGEAEAE